MHIRILLGLSFQTVPILWKLNTGHPKDYPAWKSVVEVMPTLLQKMDGDILVFMDGAYEISHAVNSILSSTWSRV